VYGWLWLGMENRLACFVTFILCHKTYK
jgi:hypothetical protein